MFTKFKPRVGLKILARRRLRRGVPFIAGGSLGSDQETAGITEGEMLLPSGEYLFSRKQ